MKTLENKSFEAALSAGQSELNNPVLSIEAGSALQHNAPCGFNHFLVLAVKIIKALQSDEIVLVAAIYIYIYISDAK